MSIQTTTTNAFKNSITEVTVGGLLINSDIPYQKSAMRIERRWCDCSDCLKFRKFFRERRHRRLRALLKGAAISLGIGIIVALICELDTPRPSLKMWGWNILIGTITATVWQVIIWVTRRCWSMTGDI